MLPDTALFQEKSETVTPKIRVVIVDDNFVMRAGLKSALSLEADFEIVGEGKNGLEAVELAERLKPDLLVMDFRMPLLDGVGATERIIAIQPDARILITTWSEEPATLIGAILAGAKGYMVHGRFSLPELVMAVRSVYEGGALITPQLVPVLLELVKSKAGSFGDIYPEALPDEIDLTQANSTAKTPLLTRRERDILELVQQGKSNREIAEVLVIEEKTVKNHINNLYSKLQVKNRKQAISYQPEAAEK